MSSNLIEKIVDLREAEEQKNGIRNNIIRDRIVGDLPGIEVLEKFRDGDANKILDIARTLNTELSSEHMVLLRRLYEAAVLMERQNP